MLKPIDKNLREGVIAPVIRETRMNHEAFLQTLNELELSPKIIRLIDEAYEMAKSAHRGQVRDGEVDASGEKLRYFEHPKSVASILLNECRAELAPLHDNSIAVLIMSALLHDVPEDTTALGSRRTDFPGQKITWREIVRERINRIDPWKNNPDAIETDPLSLHHETLSTVVLGVTKLDLEELAALGIISADPNFKDLKLKLSVVMVESSGPAAVVIKAADRLANLRTMDNLEAQRVLKQIRETEKHFIPIFEAFSSDISNPFASVTMLLFEKIKDQIKTLRSRLDVATIDGFELPSRT